MLSTTQIHRILLLHQPRIPRRTILRRNSCFARPHPHHHTQMLKMISRRNILLKSVQRAHRDPLLYAQQQNWLSSKHSAVSPARTPYPHSWRIHDDLDNLLSAPILENLLEMQSYIGNIIDKVCTYTPDETIVEEFRSPSPCSSETTIQIPTVAKDTIEEREDHDAKSYKVLVEKYPNMFRTLDFNDPPDPVARDVHNNSRSLDVQESLIPDTAGFPYWIGGDTRNPMRQQERTQASRKAYRRTEPYRQAYESRGERGITVCVLIFSINVCKGCETKIIQHNTAP
ncbi:hypothetical protein BDN70DRAFT_531623 [Pholiota conissans]|uniref:Uncharacterized protein n=1 Tax=Pholiota conissans TaxID=109636 RepID=A0A9P5YQD1_9AGAR|nr:hypothetical protein BDN70DRAFT_531623 [Pholiota conissans]